MKFTNRFIELPIELFNKKTAELTGNNDAETICTTAKINPFDISYYMPTCDSQENLTKTMLYLRNGESLFVDLSLKEVEAILNKIP